MPPKENQEYKMLIKTQDGKELPFNGTLIMDDLVPTDSDIDLSRVMRLRDMKFGSFGNTLRFSCKFVMDNKRIIFLTTGKWPSNNWMKMHGLPMSRRQNKKERLHGQRSTRNCKKLHQ